MAFRQPLDPVHPELTLPEPAAATESRIVSRLLACLAAIMGFLAFNVIDGVFGLAQAIFGLAVWMATTALVFRRSSPGVKDRDV